MAHAAYSEGGPHGDHDGGLDASAAEPEGPNPFTTPSDERIFHIREEERLRKKQMNEEMRKLSVQQKTTFSSQMQRTQSAGVSHRHQQQAAEAGQRESLAASALPPVPVRRRQKEDMAEFLAKKREIFLVQMSLDTKQAEIRKLEERTMQRGEALKKSERMLEEDALQFDNFLKENEDQVQQAIKKAEVEAKARADRVMDIKRLNTQIAMLKSEMNKYEELREYCMRFKKFLDCITPQQWFDHLQKKRDQRHQQRVEEWQATCEQVRRSKTEAAAAKAKAEYEFANARTQQEAEAAEQAIRDTAQRLKEVVLWKEPEFQEEEPEEEDVDMYFDDPAQLLRIYKELEEQNLFLIQNLQETEEALEDLRSKRNSTKERLDREVDTLELHIRQLEAAIEEENGKTMRLRERTIENTGKMSVLGLHTISLDDLLAKISEVYSRCGFDRDPSISILQMLTNIESKLEEYLDQVESMPVEFWEAAEKAREKDRRQQAREEKVMLQRREHEQRVKKALARAAAPVFKKAGKPVMFRSTHPNTKKVVQEGGGRESDDAELEAFLACEMV